MAFRSGLIGALIGLLAASAAVAKPTVWECSFADASGEGWVAPLVIVAHEAGDSEASVVDGIIKEFVGTPIAAQVVTENTSRITFSWKFRTRDRRGVTATMLYRLTIQKADRSAHMTVQALGFVGPYFSNGRCKRSKG